MERPKVSSMLKENQQLWADYRDWVRGEAYLWLFNDQQLYCRMHRAISRPDFEPIDRIRQLIYEFSDRSEYYPERTGKLYHRWYIGEHHPSTYLRESDWLKILEHALEGMEYDFANHTEHHDYYYENGMYKEPVPMPKVKRYE